MCDALISFRKGTKTHKHRDTKELYKDLFTKRLSKPLLAALQRVK